MAVPKGRGALGNAERRNRHLKGLGVVRKRGCNAVRRRSPMAEKGQWRRRGKRNSRNGSHKEVQRHQPDGHSRWPFTISKMVDPHPSVVSEAHETAISGMSFHSLILHVANVTQANIANALRHTPAFYTGFVFLVSSNAYFLKTSTMRGDLKRKTKSKLSTCR